MGAGRIEATVADAGPLIHLNEIQGLSAFRIFQAIHIPHAVWAELVAHDSSTEADIAAIQGIHRQTVAKDALNLFVTKEGLRHLHSGELECLCLCKQNRVPLILTDDLAVRDAAKRLKITPVGSLGVIVKAFKEGCFSIDEAENHINALYHASSLFVTKTIVELAVEQLRSGRK